MFPKNPTLSPGASAPVVRKFPIWKTIKIGHLKNVDRVKEAFERFKYLIDPLTETVLHYTLSKVSAEPGEVDVVKMTLTDLGFPGGGKPEEIRAKGKELGLELCSPEEAMMLRLHYPEQTAGERVIVAMEILDKESRQPVTFQFFRDSYRVWLASLFAFPDVVWKEDPRWKTFVAFVQPRK